MILPCMPASRGILCGCKATDGSLFAQRTQKRKEAGAPPAPSLPHLTFLSYFILSSSCIPHHPSHCPPCRPSFAANGCQDVPQADAVRATAAPSAYFPSLQGSSLLRPSNSPVLRAGQTPTSTAVTAHPGFR